MLGLCLFASLISLPASLPLQECADVYPSATQMKRMSNVVASTLIVISVCSLYFFTHPIMSSLSSEHISSFGQTVTQLVSKLSARSVRWGA